MTTTSTTSLTCPVHHNTRVLLRVVAMIRTDTLFTPAPCLKKALGVSIYSIYLSNMYLVAMRIIVVCENLNAQGGKGLVGSNRS